MAEDMTRDSRENTPVEFVPYRTFKEHIQREEQMFVWMRWMFTISTLLFAVQVFFLFYIALKLN